MIIGFNGISGAGKDTAASILLNAYCFKRLAFADKLKQMVQVGFGLTHDQLWGARKDEVDAYWGETAGAICQRVGTECMRDGYGEDFWIRALFRQIEPHEHYVITDVRFPNEAQAVRAWGGRMFRIIRPGHVSNRPNHSSETALDDWGWGPHNTILNDGSPADLARSVVATCLHSAIV